MNTEFQNQNKFINYPFRENASLFDIGGGLQLRPKFLVDFVVYGVEAGRKYYLVRTQWTPPSLLTLYFQDDLGNGFSEVNVALAGTPLDHADYRVYTFVSTDYYVRGRVVIDRNAAYQIWGTMGFATTHTFAPDATDFEQGVVIPAETSVVTLAKLGDVNTFQGDVKLKEGYNIQLTRDSTGVTIESFKGAGKGVICDDKEICYALVDQNHDGINEKLCGLDRALMKISQNATADENCNVFIQGDECIRVWKYPDKHMIVLHNECSKVCDEDLLLAEIECRLCRLQVARGLIPGPCDAECANAPPESQWHHFPPWA